MRTVLFTIAVGTAVLAGVGGSLSFAGSALGAGVGGSLSFASSSLGVLTAQPGPGAPDYCLDPRQPSDCKDFCPGGNSCCLCCEEFTYNAEKYAMCQAYCLDVFSHDCTSSQ